jgi:hypothetical protein
MLYIGFCVISNNNDKKKTQQKKKQQDIDKLNHIKTTSLVSETKVLYIKITDDVR